MIIKKTILNHNFVPMYINSIENIVRGGDKKTPSDLWTLEYEDEKIFIKPYQTAEVLLSINTTQAEFNGTIYLDSIYHSDLYDAFGTITGWDIQFKKNFSIYNFHEEPIMVPYRPGGNCPEVDIELSLFESGKMFNQVLDSFRKAGFDPVIKNVDVYAPWLYGVFQCCPPNGPPPSYQSIKWGTWTMGDPYQNILLPGKIKQDGDDWFYVLNMKSEEVEAHLNAIRTLMDTATGYQCKGAPILSRLNQLFSPYGLKVTLDLTPDSDKPYIVTYHLFNSIIWLPYETSEAPVGGLEPSDHPFLYDHTGNILQSQIGLMFVPNALTVNTHSDENYSFELNIILPYAASAPVEITDIELSPPNGLLSLNHKALPQTLLGSVNGLRDEFGTLNVLLNVASDLTTDYVGTVTVGYLWDGVPKQEVIDVNLLPDLVKFSATDFDKAFFEIMIPDYQIIEADLGSKAQININYNAYLGTKDRMFLTLSNVGNGEDVYKGIIYDKSKFKVKDLNPTDMVIPANTDVELEFEIDFLQKFTTTAFPFKLKTANEGTLSYIEDVASLGFDPDSVELNWRFTLQKPKIFASSFEKTRYIQKGSYVSIPFNVTGVGLSVINIEITGLDDESFFFDKKYLPFLTGQTQKALLDFNIFEEGLHDATMTLYTDNAYLPYISVPMSLFVSDFNLQEDFVFDEGDFYVDENKYHLSLVKLEPKTRFFKFKFMGNYPLKIEGITTYQQQDEFGVNNLDVEILNAPQLPQTLVQNDEIMIEVEFSALEFGYTLFFFIINTSFGDIYMPVSAFCNTKYKDVYITSQTDAIVEYTSIMGGYNRQFIKLANYGDQICEIETMKLGYDKDEFLVKDKGYLSPNGISYIDTVFLPAVTGKRSAYLDVQLHDMLNTFLLNTDFTSKSVKIQASHIIYKMYGIAVSEEAFPKFNHEIIDFGYLNLDDVDTSQRVRYSTVDIQNLGLNPYVVLNITKADPNSPFKLLHGHLPTRPRHDSEFPIVIDYEKIKGPGTYYDVFTFTLQDLKTKKDMVFNIPIKVEFTTSSEIYVAVNSELIEFGYAEIGHQKSDELIIRNYSTDRILLTIDYTGDYEFTTYHPMTIGLSPSQSYTLPMHFFPHGINTFTGKITITVDTFVQEVNLIGQGVDFKSPLIHTTNKLYDFFKELGYR